MELTVALAQYPITKFQSFENYESHIRKWIDEALYNNAELLVFPEYASMEIVSIEQPKNLSEELSFIQKYKFQFISLYQKFADELNIAIIAPSFPEKVGENYVNRTYVFMPKVKEQFQDKIMMTRFEDEEFFVKSGGGELKVFEFKNIKFGITTCFDGEFPDFARALCLNGVELILQPSCTETLKGMERVHIGARARALENQCFVGVSQLIKNANWLYSVDINNGFSAFYSTPDLDFPTDGILKKGELNSPSWLIHKLDFQQIKSVREKGSVLNFKKIVAIPSLRIR